MWIFVGFVIFLMVYSIFLSKITYKEGFSLSEEELIKLRFLTYGIPSLVVAFVVACKIIFLN